MKMIVIVSTKCYHLTWTLEIRRLKISKELRNLFLYWHLCIQQDCYVFIVKGKGICSKEKKRDKKEYIIFSLEQATGSSFSWQ